MRYILLHTCLGVGEDQFHITISQSGGPDCTARRCESALKQTPFHSLRLISLEMSFLTIFRLLEWRLYVATCVKGTAFCPLDSGWTFSTTAAYFWFGALNFVMD